MKKFATFLSTMVLAIVSSVSAFAQGEKPLPKFSDVATDGTAQYIFNVEAEAFLLGANDWSTRASVAKDQGLKFQPVLSANGTEFTLANDRGAMFIDSWNGSIWVDNATRAESKTWGITEIGTTKTYSITNSSYGNPSHVLAAHSPLANDTRLYFADPTDANYSSVWAFVNEDDFAQYFTDLKAWTLAQDTPGADITSAFDNLNPSIVNAGGWTLPKEWSIETAAQNGAFHINTWSGEGASDGSNMTTPFFERWVGGGEKLNPCVMSTVLTGLQPSSLYEVSALFRVLYENGGLEVNKVELFAGDNTVDVCSKGTAMNKGIYGTPSVYGMTDEKGTLVVGVRVLEGTNASWVTWKNFKVTYLADSDLAPWLGDITITPENDALLLPEELSTIDFDVTFDKMFKDPSVYNVTLAGTIKANGSEKPFEATGVAGQPISIDATEYAVAGTSITVNVAKIRVADTELEKTVISEDQDVTSTFSIATLTEIAINEYKAAVAEADALSLHASTHIGVGVMLYLPAKVAQYKKDLALAKSLASDYKIYNDYKEGTALINYLVRELQPQYPDLNQRYLVQHKASGLYLNADDGVKLNSVPTPVAFHHVEGAKEASRYFMYSTPDREYICYEGSNPWTMTNKTVSIEGGKFIIKHHCDLDPAGVRKDVYYSLVGMNGVLGSNADLAKDPGIYGDKKEGDANAQWLLIPYEEPDPSDMSVKPTPKTTALATDGNTIQYLYNADADAFFTQGNAWGTQASYLPTVGNQFKVSIAGGTTEIINLVPNKNNAWMNPFIDAQGGIYVDNGGDPNSHAWSINVLEDGSFEITNTIVATDKKVGIDPAEKKNIIQMTNAEGAYTKWFAVSEEDFNAYVMARLAYDKWVKENTTIQPGDDVTYLADGAAFTSALGTPGTVADWAWSGHEGAAELYNQGAINAGDVLVMSLSDIQNGVYDVTLEVAASFTPGRGFEAPVGEGLAEAFANSATEAIEVFERESVGADGADVVTLTAVVTDGTLKFGVRNLESAGNWFLCDLKSIVFVSKDVKSVLIKTPEATEISSVSSSAAPAAIYSVNGAQLKSMQKGMNIVKMADGQVKKVLVK